jgi:drug/metabolite transporter (DMT)-like permease
MSGTGMPSGVSRSVLLMLLSVFLFASNALLVRAVATHAPQADGWLAALLRGVVGLAVVFALFGFGRGLRPAGMFNNRLVFLRGVVGAFGILAFYITVTRMGAARAVILNLTYPLWGSIIAALWLKERIRPAAMVWMVAGFAGLLLFLGGDGTLLPPKPLDLLGLAGAMTAGWVVVIIRRLRHEEHPATVYASQAFYGLLFALPAAGRIGQLPSAAVYGLVAAAVLVALAQLSMTRAYRDLSVSRGSAMQMLLPVVTAIGAYLFFDEKFHLLEYAGAALTMLATWRIVSLR